MQKALHPDVEFCLELSTQFAPSIQVTAMRSLIVYLQRLPEEKPKGILNSYKIKSHNNLTLIIN